MSEKNKKLLKSTLPIVLLVIIDLVLKHWVAGNLPLGQRKEFLGGLLTIIRIDNFGRASGLSFNLNVWEWGSWAFKILSLALFVVILRKETLHIFKLSSCLVLGGWIGNILDRLLLSQGNQAYRFMDYLYEGILTHSVLNISSLMPIAGWITLLISIIIKFREFKMIFFSAGRRTETEQNVYF